METSIIPQCPDDKSLRNIDVRCFGREEGEPCQRIKRRLLEVFSIQFFDWQVKNFEGVFGMIVLQTPIGPYMLSKRNIDSPNNVDQDGFVTLTGPERGIEASNYVYIVPFLYHLIFAAYDCSIRHDLWRADMEGNENLYDLLMFQRMRTLFGTMEVSYAIYTDGAEACLDVTIIDWEGEEVEVYGTVSVRNSKVSDPKARSWLYNSKSEEAIRVCRRKVTHLPLLRQVSVLPLGSDLIVDVCLLHGGTIFAKGILRFITKDTGNEERILICNPGKVKLKVTWLKQQVDNKASEH